MEVTFAQFPDKEHAHVTSGHYLPRSAMFIDQYLPNFVSDDDFLHTKLVERRDVLVRL